MIFCKTRKTILSVGNTKGKNVTTYYFLGIPIFTSTWHHP